MIEIGKYNLLKVVRKTDLGYMVSDGHEEILMHYKQAAMELEINQEVNVYVYTDKVDRKTGTMNEPLLIMDKPAFVEVVNVLPQAGVFISNHTPKDLFISKDYLPYNEEQWPVVGDQLFCHLKIKKNALTAKPLNRFEIQNLKAQKRYAEQEKVQANVCHIALKGMGLITKDLIYVFVPNAQFRNSYRLGEEVTVTITKMLDQEAYGMLNEHKELLMEDDKKLILDYLKAHNDVMPITAKSSSEEVEKLFSMSRKAFKRAYGALYKEHLIDFDEKKTFLNKL